MRASAAIHPCHRPSTRRHLRRGITASSLGPPDLALALEQHDAYCRTLERLGLSLVRLAPDPDFPDSTFVEDSAIVITRGAILTRPGAASRARRVLPSWPNGWGGTASAPA